MSFDAAVFWLFFPIAWMAWRLLPFQFAKGVLLLLSLVFYAWWNPWYVLLLIGPTALDYVAGQKIYDTQSLRVKRGWLLLTIISNLGLLAFFKYGAFVLTNAQAASGWFGWHWQAPAVSWVIPVGISFYTFQVLSYSFDIYRGKLAPARNFVNFLQFICFFPHLVAGPIVRAHELLPQFDHRRRLSLGAIQGGIYYIIWGLFMKMVVADNIAMQVDFVFNADQLAKTDWLSTWLTVILFAGQIFADFAGYSSIAIGLAMLMGIKFPKNFNYPYISSSFSEFWTRWHITLSRWLRDYLYIPLGGNRKGKYRTYSNLMVTMLLGGLWHGANWTFVVWGAMHGGALAVERMFSRGKRTSQHRYNHVGRISFLEAIRRLSAMAFVFVFLLVTWVFFRSPTFSLAIAMLQKMFVAPFHGGTRWPFWINRYLYLLIPIVLLHMMQLSHEWFGLRKNAYARATFAAVMAFAILVVQRQGEHVFIYFQF